MKPTLISYEKFIQLERENDLHTLKYDDWDIWPVFGGFMKERRTAGDGLPLDSQNSEPAGFVLKSRKVATFLKVATTLLLLRPWIAIRGKRKFDIATIPMYRREHFRVEHQGIEKYLFECKYTYWVDLLYPENNVRLDTLDQLPLKWMILHPDSADLSVRYWQSLRQTKIEVDETQFQEILSQIDRVYSLVEAEKRHLRWKLVHFLKVAEAVRPVVSHMQNVLGIKAVLYVSGSRAICQATSHLLRSEDANVWVAELQHGQHNPHSYWYQSWKDYPCKPDAVLCFGNNPTKFVRFGERDAGIATGFPYHQQFWRYLKQSHSYQKGSKVLTVISQDIVGQDLLDLAIEVAQKLPEWNVIFKLHPNEFGIVESYRRQVSEKDLDNLDFRRDRLYESICEADALLGANSTALFEAVEERVPIYLKVYERYRAITDILEKAHLAIGIDSAEELVECLKNCDAEFIFENASEFFEPAALENMKRTLDAEIISRTRSAT